MRQGTTYALAVRTGESSAQQQMNTTGGNTAQSITLNRDCAALILSARTGNAYVTFDDSTPSATNGLEIIAGAQPVTILLGYFANTNHTLRCIGSVASTILNVVQLA